MIEINLVPDVKQELIHAQRVRMSVMSISTVIGLVAIGVVIVMGLLLGVQGARGLLLDNSISANSKKLEQVPDINKTLTIQNQLDQIATIHDSEHVNSRIFSVLTSLAQNGSEGAIQYSSVAIDSSSNTVTVQAQTPTFNGLDAYKKTLAATQFQYTTSGSSSPTTESLASNIGISNQTQAQDSTGNKVVTFTLSFTYDNALVSPSSQNAKTILPQATNATDSYKGIPASLFTDKAGGNS